MIFCPLPKPEEVDLVIYHAGCMDGLASALAAWLLLGDQAEYLPWNYGTEPPDVTGKSVAIVDFSFKRHQLDEMAKGAKALIVIDHHKTAKAELDGFMNAIFDMDRAGCVLAWRWFHEARRDEVPLLFLYIEDRDLWAWALDQSKAVNAALRSYPWTIEQLGKFMAIGSIFDDGVQLLQRLKDEGAAILRFQHIVVMEHAERADLGVLKQVQSGDDVPVAVTHATGKQFTSDIGHAMCEEYPDRVAVVWSCMQGQDELLVSLRRHEDNTIDLGALARQFGGGGHPAAAGFKARELPIDWEGER